MSDSPFERTAAIKAWAREFGFDLVGIALPQPSAYGAAFHAWLAAGKQGEMQYLARNFEERLDLRKKFPWAKSAVCVALGYWQDAAAPVAPTAEQRHAAGGSNESSPSPTGKPPSPTGKIARYAWGRDYHKVIEAKLKKLERKIRAAFETPAEKLEVRAYADTGPVLERELAARAGLGWIGKNTLLIHPRQGSWFVLGELLLSLELAADVPLGDHCGTCRRCIDACPTGAIEPYSVDARKCVSYLTLEHRGVIADTLREPMRQAQFVAGCDICQEVCPFNRQPLACREADFALRSPAPAVSLREVLAWQEQEWDILTRGRATRRAKFAMWKRNAGVLAGALDFAPHHDPQ